MTVLPATEPRTVEETAANWFALRRSGPLGTEEAQAFEAWLAAEPEHRAAYDNLEHYWHAAAAVREDPQVLAMRDAADRRWRIRRAHKAPPTRPRQASTIAALKLRVSQ